MNPAMRRRCDARFVVLRGTRRAGSSENVTIFRSALIFDPDSEAPAPVRTD